MVDIIWLHMAIRIQCFSIFFLPATSFLSCFLDSMHSCKHHFLSCHCKADRSLSLSFSSTTLSLVCCCVFPAACLSHLQMSDIGLIIFDEAHHCKSDHPYNQLLQDFYHVMDAAARPQILGLTASPDGVEPDSRRRKGRPFNPGLQHNMNAFLITVPAEGPLRFVCMNICIHICVIHCMYVTSRTCIGVDNLFTTQIYTAKFIIY